MASDEDLESRRIVRMYSWDFEERLPEDSEAYALGQVLCDDRGDRESITEPWRKFFEPAPPSVGDKNPITEVIEKESTNLRRKWARFRNHCPREEQVDLQDSEPTIEGVTDMVNGMMKAWKAKRGEGWSGKALSGFHRFCRTLDSHSSLLKVLPEGNEYVSVFTGTLNAVIKASVRHERVAEGFSEALCIISEHVVYCKAELELFQTKDMLEGVADLYSHVFLFLSNVMDWMMEKRHRRLLDSFNENLRKTFDDQIQAISKRAEQIRHVAEQSSRAETRSTRLIGESTHAQLREMKQTIDKLERDMRLGLEGEARRMAEQSYFEARREREFLEMKREREQITEGWRQLVAYTKNMLQDGAMRSIKDRNYVPFQILSRSNINYDGDSVVEVAQWEADDVQLNSKDLERFFHRDRLRPANFRSGPVMVNEEILGRLSTWTESKDSRFLWLEGTQNRVEDQLSVTASTAAKFVELADLSRVPVISYFCELRRGDKIRSGNTGESQAMVSLVYALLRQLIELLLPHFDADIDLSETRFERLDGSLNTWPDAISIFGDLLSLAPEIVCCVVDGLDYLDDRSTDSYLKEFLQLLRTDKLKVLFTTVGRSKGLREELSRSEIVQLGKMDLGRANMGLDRQEFWPT
ncbi:hypothetical protein NA57DRAFT_70913 [Rhizodiscina lignyota]|uniref:Uncharacterized protein n=1 Tax=Rhizodiscina lignyota TaxID=1504668 RepID=A0A9P4IND9_9PEZI|nr:hypothetical protein NA57DRAFT_70913 [Rhizodiscina lignyota]